MGAKVNGRVELISQAEYARRRGVAKSAVAKAVAEKRITLINGKVDPAVADIQWAQNTRARIDNGRATSQTRPGEAEALPLESMASAGSESAAPEASPQARDDYQDLRIRRERAAVEREERENEREAGLLVRKARVERATFDAFRALRDAVMLMPQRSAPKVVGMADARDIEQIMVEELRKAFAAWEIQIERRLKEMVD